MLRVVAIEDSRTQAVRLVHILETAGFEVELARNGEEGLEACKARRPDVVVSDVIMPGMDGYEVCRRIKADPALKNVPVLLATSLAEPKDVMRAVAAGADNYLTKPYDDERLPARIRRVVGAARDPNKVSLGEETFDVGGASARLPEILTSTLEDAASRYAEVESNRAALARAEQGKNEMVRLIAHDIRTPLNAMMLRAELARQYPDKTEILQKLPELVVKHVATMVRLLDDLSQVARSDEGSLSLEVSEVDLVQVVADIMPRLEMLSTDHSFEVSLPDKLEIRVDAPRIEQVLSNLVSNAIKYSPKGGKVTVALKKQATQAMLSVCDEGIGIPEASLDRVFDRGFRTNEGQAEATGAGLGLFICRELIELHGGRIWAESNDGGKGTTFRVTLPTA